MSSSDILLTKNYKQLNRIAYNTKGRLFREICKFIFQQPNNKICSTRLRDLYKQNLNIKNKLKLAGGPKKFIESTNFVFKQNDEEYKLYWEVQNANGFGLISLKRLVTNKDLEKINERLDKLEIKK